MNPYSSLCDDFGVYVYVNTKMELPTRRESILNFFDSLRKTFPADDRLRMPGNWGIRSGRGSRTGKLSLGQPGNETLLLRLHESAGAGSWPTTITNGCWRWLRITSTSARSIARPWTCLFAFDFMYQGNHDEVVAEALGLNTTLENLVQMPGTKVINYEPSLMLALDDACRLQCRLCIETRTNAFQIRTGQFPEAPISVYFTVRQYWGRQGGKTFGESYKYQRKVLQELVDQHIIPSVIQPLNRTITNKQ